MVWVLPAIVWLILTDKVNSGVYYDMRGCGGGGGGGGVVSLRLCRGKTCGGVFGWDLEVAVRKHPMVDPSPDKVQLWPSGGAKRI